MANSEKHKQRSARSYHKKIAEARSFARLTWWKNEGRQQQRKQRRSLKERAKNFFKKLRSRQKKG